MAKRRRAKTKTITRYVKSKPAKRRKSYSKENLTKMMIGSAIYGGVRQKASNMLAPITSKVPLGVISDELVLGTIHYFAAKKVRNPMLKSIFKAGLIVESARVGEAIADGSLGSFGATSNGGQNVF